MSDENDMVRWHHASSKWQPVPVLDGSVVPCCPAFQQHTAAVAFNVMFFDAHNLPCDYSTPDMDEADKQDVERQLECFLMSRGMAAALNRFLTIRGRTRAAGPRGVS